MGHAILSPSRAGACAHSDFSTCRGFVHRLAIYSAGGSAGHRTCGDHRVNIARSDCAGSDAWRDGYSDFQDPGNAHRTPNLIFPAWRLCSVLCHRRSMAHTQVQTRRIRQRDQVRRSPFNPRESGCRIACNLLCSAIPAAHHGNAKAAAHKSFAGLWIGIAAHSPAAGSNETVFVRVDARHRVGVRCGARMRMALQPLRFCPTCSTADLVFGFLKCFRRLSVPFLAPVQRENRSVGHGRDGLSASVFPHPSAGNRSLSKPTHGVVADGVCDPAAAQPCRHFETSSRSQSGANNATGLVRRCGVVLYHADFPDSVRASMDYHRMGDGRHGVAVVVPPFASHRTTPCRHRTADCSIRAARVKPGSIRISRAQRNAHC